MDKRNWQASLTEVAEGGAGIMHRLTKPTVRWRPRLGQSEVGAAQRQAQEAGMDPEKVAAEDHDDLATIWRVADTMQTAQRPWRTNALPSALRFVV